MVESAHVPRLFHQTGATRQLTWEERTLLRRTRRMLDTWDYSYWTDRDLFDLFDAEYPQWAQAYRDIRTGVVRADLGRYAMLHARGGLYIDTDYKFVQSPAELLVNDCTLPVEDDAIDSFRLGNACLASIKGHPFWLALLTDIFERHSPQQLDAADPIETTGPVALTRFWMDHHESFAGVATPPMKMYYPDLTWSRVGIAKSRDSVGIHMCWGTWRSRGILHGIKTVARRKISSLI